MNEKNRELVTGGLLLALGIIVPIIFHSAGILGQVFLPMHIPVLIGGFLLSPHLALTLGIITPLLSGLLTGMPPIYPMAIIMAFELGTYGIIASLSVRKFKISTIPSLIISMLSGRIAAGLTVFFLVSLFKLKMNPVIFVKGAIVTGIPGIIIQLIIVPVLIYSLNHYYKKPLANEKYNN